MHLSQRGRAELVQNPAAQASHRLEPLVVVGGFEGDEAGDLGMGQDQEAFPGDALDDGVGHGGGREQARLIGGGFRILVAEQGRRHVLRADDRDPDAVAAMGDCEGFGEADGGVLGGGIGGVADLVQQARGGGHLQQVARAAIDHAGEQRAGGIDMGHDMHLPGAGPVGVAGRGGMGGFAQGQPGIGTEQVDRAECGFGGADEVLDVGLPRDVAGKAEAAEGRGHGAGGATVEIGHDDARAPGREAPGHRRADAACPAGDDDGLVLQVHGGPPVGVSGPPGLGKLGRVLREKARFGDRKPRGAVTRPAGAVAWRVGPAWT